MIGKNVKIGMNVVIGHNTVIEDGCIIGDGVFIGHNCVLRPETIVGKRTKIGHNTVIEGWLTIGEDCFIQAQCNITKGMNIGDKVFIGQMVVSGNDKRMVHLRRETAPFNPTPPTVMYGARIGMGALLLPGCVVGRETFIGAGAVVVGKCNDYGVYVGNPAKFMEEIPSNERLDKNGKSS